MAKEDNSKICAILSYFLVGIVWYFVDEKMKKNAFVKYHVKQGLNLLIIGVAFSIAWSILTGILAIVTMGFALIVLAPVSMLISLAEIVLWIFGIVYAAQNTQKPIPVIGIYADKYLKF
jgi:uncharacterized membrane protein